MREKDEELWCDRCFFFILGLKAQSATLNFKIVNKDIYKSDTLDFLCPEKHPISVKFKRREETVLQCRECDRIEEERKMAEYKLEKE